MVGGNGSAGGPCGALSDPGGMGTETKLPCEEDREGGGEDIGGGEGDEGST